MKRRQAMSFKNVADADKKLREVGYISSQEIATVVFLAGATQKPVLVEGPAGVGKTELAKAVAKALRRDLIRLQCYEGLDESKPSMTGNIPNSSSTPRC
jgi:MoxR-like ATPase